MSEQQHDELCTSADGDPCDCHQRRPAAPAPEAHAPLTGANDGSWRKDEPQVGFALGAPEAPAEPLTDLLREFSAQLAEWDLWKSDPTQAFENLAAEFYRETGLLAPGKSVPLEMANADDDALRRQRYAEWGEARRVRRQAMLRRVEQALAEHATQQAAIKAQKCATCAHLRPFELAPELNTCPVVNIRIHTESAAVFGCNQWEPRADVA